VAAEGFQAPGVVVSYTTDDGLHTGKAFLARGPADRRRRAAAVRRRADFKTFRIGLFGLDKLHHVERTVANLRGEVLIDRQRLEDVALLRHPADAGRGPAVAGSVCSGLPGQPDAPGMRRVTPTRVSISVVLPVPLRPSSASERPASSVKRHVAQTTASP
jgi:hypothetical protein